MLPNVYECCVGLVCLAPLWVRGRGRLGRGGNFPHNSLVGSPHSSVKCWITNHHPSCITNLLACFVACSQPQSPAVALDRRLSSFANSLPPQRPGRAALQPGPAKTAGTHERWLRQPAPPLANSVSSCDLLCASVGKPPVRQGARTAKTAPPCWCCAPAGHAAPCLWPVAVKMAVAAPCSHASPAPPPPHFTREGGGEGGGRGAARTISSRFGGRGAVHGRAGPAPGPSNPSSALAARGVGGSFSWAPG